MHRDALRAALDMHSSARTSRNEECRGGVAGGDHTPGKLNGMA